MIFKNMLSKKRTGKNTKTRNTSTIDITHPAIVLKQYNSNTYLKEIIRYPFKKIWINIGF